MQLEKRSALTQPSPPAGTIQMGTGGNRGNGGFPRHQCESKAHKGFTIQWAFPNLKKLVLCCFHTSVPSVASCSIAWFRPGERAGERASFLS